MSRRYQSGFSLIEVLVAFVLLGMTLAVIMQIFSGGLRNASAAKHRAQAMVLAESKLELLGSEIPLEQGGSQGENGPFAWEIEIYPFDTLELSEDDAPTSAELLAIKISVHWKQGTRIQSLTLDTLRVGSPE